MSPIGVVLLVFFIIVCALLILLVAIQDDGENGMGGLLGGRGTAAFGSHSANVLTRVTGVLVALFFILSFALAFVNRNTNKVDLSTISAGVEAEAQAEESAVPATSWWAEEDEEAEDESEDADEAEAEDENADEEWDED